MALVMDQPREFGGGLTEHRIEPLEQSLYKVHHSRRIAAAFHLRQEFKTVPGGHDPCRLA